ncbi:MAG: hypothetical protein MHM6MM_004157 [Cercozoa sp. M6MM]
MKLDIWSFGATAYALLRSHLSERMLDLVSDAISGKRTESAKVTQYLERLDAKYNDALRLHALNTSLMDELSQVKLTRWTYRQSVRPTAGRVSRLAVQVTPAPQTLLQQLKTTLPPGVAVRVEALLHDTLLILPQLRPSATQVRTAIETILQMLRQPAEVQ